MEALGFVDGDVSLRWLSEVGCRVVNLLAKGSLKHCEKQLRKTPQQHIADIKATVATAHAMGVTVNIYLEDWSNGMKHSPEYVFTLVDALQNEGIQRFMLPDTLGVLNPDNTYEYAR